MRRRVQAPQANRKYALRRKLYHTRHLTSGASNTPTRGQADSASAETTAALQEEITQLKELIVRQRAEFDNFRKRTQREKDQIREAASENVLAKLLPVVDNFERALVSSESVTEVKPVRDGVAMIFSQLQRVLEGEGLHQVEALHKPFDPNQHDALASEERTDVPDNHVCEVLLPGYLFKEKLLRPAMVKVAKLPAGEQVKSGG